MKINAEWHKMNVMPNPPAGGPTLQQRIAWHIAHAKNCGCRPIPQSMQKEIEK
ncbi:hypothetical protein HYW55_05330 [Candidatus Gottesmanbacteria bacterium]|nr:hypothetical protein [Candidatus Gottesmanbacteria bacterium]